RCAAEPWGAAPPPTLDTCDNCQQIVTFLTTIANESATKVAVEGFLQRECAALPLPSLVSPCRDLLHRHLDRVVTDLESRLKPSVICARLELCPGEPGGPPAVPLSGALSTHLQVPTGEGLPLPLPLCWLCRTFVARAEAVIPVEKVAAAAAGLCRVLPVVAAGACQCLAQRYAALALEGVLGRLGPRLLCRLLFVCRPESGDAPLSPPGPALAAAVALLAACVGTEDPGAGHPLPALSPKLGPCALGPAYWCSSPEAAHRCQALQHCQEHVWM
ncbi:pulmonary surfactant-associated protein B, partial [Falco naumanni]|uniref:pulmonary surfactant-associated protein B n=1 Tax=Falco naumanni TaxID=148594 RepID=UPI001ADE4A47